MERAITTNMTENGQKPMRKPLDAYTPDEQAIIRWVQGDKGRELTEALPAF
jgi:hypothetical protein